MTTENPRTRAAVQMVREIDAYLQREIPAGVLAWEYTWEMADRPGVLFDRDISRYEAGEITFDELEQSGTRYVEAFHAAVTAWQRRAAA